MTLSIINLTILIHDALNYQTYRPDTRRAQLLILKYNLEIDLFSDLTLFDDNPGNI